MFGTVFNQLILFSFLSHQRKWADSSSDFRDQLEKITEPAKEMSRYIVTPESKFYPRKNDPCLSLLHTNCYYTKKCAIRPILFAVFRFHMKMIVRSFYRKFFKPALYTYPLSDFIAALLFADSFFITFSLKRLTNIFSTLMFYLSKYISLLNKWGYPITALLTIFITMLKF